MQKKYDRVLFIFRRDLRLEDNTGLLFALKQAKEVIPCFIFTPEQIDRNPYRSDFCLQFMMESLEDLNDSLKKRGSRLHLFFDHPETIVAQCAKSVDAVVVNQDYTPYSLARDEKIKRVCLKEGMDFHSFEDALLHPMAETLKGDENPYTIFTPYFRNASRLEVNQPAANKHRNFACIRMKFEEKESLLERILPKRFELMRGGRRAALKVLKNLGKFKDYPAEEATTHLSAHLKFTTCSVREAYYAIKEQLGIGSGLIRALYWRDFFTSIAWHFPEVFQGAFHSKFNKLSWNNDKKLFKLWCEGKTGFPIVDAGMRQMNATGFMHNRVRMITASFLVKDLHVDWRWGEKYFAKTLIDYDPAVNNGNWQWVASTGCDAQPYFRVFNPWSQQEKFDPECIYIKKWVPELRDLSSESIHHWYEEEHWLECPHYPSPIADHAKESKITLGRYRKAAKK